MGNQPAKIQESEGPLDESVSSQAFGAVASGRVDKLHQYSTETLQSFKSTKDGKSLLHWAVLHGQDSCVEFLLENGVNADYLDKWGNTPLMEIANCKSVNSAKVKNIIKLLIKSNANINAVESHRRTTLLRTLIHFKTQAAEILLDFGADTNLGDEDGLQPVHVCSSYANLSLLRKIICNNADINAQNSKQHTALYLAVLAGHQEIVDELLKHGVNVNLASVYGCPLQTALVKNKYDTVLKLLQHGASINFKVCEPRQQFNKAKDALNLALIVLHLELSKLRQKTSTEAFTPHDQLHKAALILELVIQANGANVITSKNIFFLSSDAAYIFNLADHPLFAKLKRLCRKLKFLNEIGTNHPPIPWNQIPRVASTEDCMSLQNQCRMKVRHILTGRQSNVLYAVKQLDCTTVVKDMLLLKDIM